MMRERDKRIPVDLSVIVDRMTRLYGFADEHGLEKNPIEMLDLIDRQICQPNFWVLELDDMIFILTRVKQIRERDKAL